VVIATWLIGIVCIAIGLIFDYRLAQVGRHDLMQFRGTDLIFVPPLLSAGLVGSALALRHPRHPVGWLFLALGLSIAMTAAIDGYTDYGAVARPGSLAGAGFFATLSDNWFITWLVLLGFIILLTPSGRLTAVPARVATGAVIVGGAVAFTAATFAPYRGDYVELGTVENPLALSGAASTLRTTLTAGLVVLHAGVLAGPVLLLLRFRSARGRERRQLRWLAFAAIPFPVLVVGAYIAATMDNQSVLALAAGGFLALIPLAAAFAIEQDHLYDVDRLLSRGLTYSLLTAGLVACYAVTVVVAGEALGDFGGDSQLPAVLATLASVSVALPARRHLQDTLDRRFNRRQHEAVASIRTFVRGACPLVSVEQALRDALRDPHVALSYWIEERARWVDEQGVAAPPRAGWVAIDRRGTRIAALSFNTEATARRTVDAVLAEALPEIENAHLRAAIALQLVEVRESRARIVAAQLSERRKIERNLHDGAQQRLLGIAMQLRAGAMSRDPEGMRSTIDAAVHQLQLAVRDLRDLANGLHPSVLDGGLAAALDELASRVPIPVHLEATPERFSTQVEAAAWFIVCEAVANAVKHADAHAVAISASSRDGRLHLAVEDDGHGGADPLGPGLRGIADRAEAAGGWLAVCNSPTGGTIVRAELPCAS
jgi:signal transduction histidine kinase